MCKWCQHKVFLRIVNSFALCTLCQLMFIALFQWGVHSSLRCRLQPLSHSHDLSVPYHVDDRLSHWSLQVVVDTCMVSGINTRLSDKLCGRWSTALEQSFSKTVSPIHQTWIISMTTGNVFVYVRHRRLVTPVLGCLRNIWLLLLQSPVCSDGN